MDLKEILNGGLLGDANIRVGKNKYYYFRYAAKDRKFLEWIGVLLSQYTIKSWIVLDNKITNVFSLGFYINNSPFPELSDLRNLWYKRENGLFRKTVPRELHLTPTNLLFWYLGDGCLVRRKNDDERVPTIVLATNCFSQNDLSVLIEKLRGLNLNFYPVKYKSGFTGKECGYCLYSKTQDGTPFRFFQLIGLECPSEIANCSTGSKGIYREEKFFKNKWPTEEDWIKILSNIKEIGPILRKRRLKIELSQNQLGKKIGIRRENIRDVELMKRNFSVKNFRRILKVLNLDINHMLTQLNSNN